MMIVLCRPQIITLMEDKTLINFTSHFVHPPLSVSVLDNIPHPWFTVRSQSLLAYLKVQIVILTLGVISFFRDYTDKFKPDLPICQSNVSLLHFYEGFMVL